MNMIYEAVVVHNQVGFILDVLKMLKTEEECVCVLDIKADLINIITLELLITAFRSSLVLY